MSPQGCASELLLLAPSVQEGATLLPHEQRDFDEMAVHHFVFDPQQEHPNFMFNVDGIDVILVSLTCRLPASPPSPPLLSPPPPSPSPAFAFAFSLGLRSFSSRVAVAVLGLLVFGRLLVSCWPSLRRSCGQPRRSVISATEMDAAQPAGDGFWSVLFDVGGSDVELPLPQTIATDVSELKQVCLAVSHAVHGHHGCGYALPFTHQVSPTARGWQALAELASEALGPKATPAAWMRGNLATMRVQYVDSEERSLKMSGRTRFSELKASPFLRVTHAAA